ncbi:Uncharacterised protein [Mycobacterium tuberculosis]|nr:Uncharacterised protein [Mycobacterium tuberculosis]
MNSTPCWAMRCSNAEWPAGYGMSNPPASTATVMPSESSAAR